MHTEQKGIHNKCVISFGPKALKITIKKKQKENYIGFTLLFYIYMCIAYTIQ